MKLVSILTLTLCAAGSALAQSDVTWVASNGASGTCSRTTPCATFAQAYAVTNANGVIKTVDAADFGIVTIMKNVTIDANASGANVLIVGAPAYGVFANGSINPVHVTTKNVTVTNASIAGIFISGASGSIRDSVFRGGNTGVYVQSAFGGYAAVALVERCELSYNTTGLGVDNTAGAVATVRVSDTVITGNAIGISPSNGGQIISFRTNMLAGNTTDGVTPFSISLK
jgi:hypothetical protein